MKRYAALVFVLLIVVGCQGQNGPPAPKDPFLFGPTRVPPPATGAAVGRGADAYFRGTASNQPAVSPRANAPTWAVATASQPEPRTSVPAKAEPVARMPASGVATAAPSAPAAARAPNLLAGREEVVRTLPPRNDVSQQRFLCPAPATVESYSRQPRPARRRVDISELPASNAQSSAAVPSEVAEPAFRLVSAVEDAAQDSGRVVQASATEPAAPRSLYGHAPDYSWVRGKLEHSQVDGRWKLRYIPVDGKTDDYGGSVVVADASVLSGYERGEFLELRGRIGEAGEEGAFAPRFEVDEVARLGRGGR